MFKKHLFLERLKPLSEVPWINGLETEGGGAKAKGVFGTLERTVDASDRFFRDLTQNRLRRGVFRDLEELFMAIGSYIDRHNENPKPFIWTARASDIFEKVKRGRHALYKRQSA